jgi:redox-sensitive bicupin YhaK (pirin superfamily)
MLQKVLCKDIFIGDYGWHTGRFHFSFADYFEPDNSCFGSLNALNDFNLNPGTGFECHPHAEMEIISYCVSGELTHIDDLGNTTTLRRGDAQFLSAGSGITHQEFNQSQNQSLRFVQIWIDPNQFHLTPKYAHITRNGSFLQNRLVKIASGENIDGTIKIAQDANIYIAELEQGQMLEYSNPYYRQSYLVVLEGALSINHLELGESDALRINNAEILTMIAQKQSHLLLIDLAVDV